MSGLPPIDPALLRAIQVLAASGYVVQPFGAAGVGAAGNGIAHDGGVPLEEETPMYAWISKKPTRHHKAWRVYYRPVDGAKPQGYLGFADSGTAQAWIDQAQAHVVKDGRPIEDVIDAYLASLPLLKDSSRTTLRFRLRAIVQGRARLPIEAFPWARAWGELVTVQSGDSQHGILAALQGLVAYAKLPGKTLEGLVVTKTKNKGKPQLRLDEARRFIQAAQEAGDPLALAAATCAFTGLRPGEVMALQARDCDDGGALLWVERGKTERAKREVEVDPQWQPVLRRQAEGKFAGDPLFPYEPTRVRASSNPVKARTDALLRRVQALCEVAGVPVVVSHSLRGLNATLRKRGGASDESVTRALGHVSIETTKRHYLAPGTADRADSRRAFGQLYPPRPEPRNPVSASSELLTGPLQPYHPQAARLR
ncbi:MAG: tyrosine-type recombinase/integrase [Myxococcales bacterium]